MLAHQCMSSGGSIRVENCFLREHMAVLGTLLLTGLTVPEEHTILEAPEILGYRFPGSLWVLGAKIPGAYGFLELLRLLESATVLDLISFDWFIG